MSSAFSCCSNPSVMLAFEQKFPSWKNFPKGLHVLVLDEDEHSLADAKLKLEACHYSVTVFSKHDASLEAIQDSSKAFHLAMLEINPSNAALVFNIMRVAKHLPTILLSDTKNVTIMMEGIAAGASEFIQKPLSEDKLKNIWQHVFRKALLTGELTIPQHIIASDPIIRDGVPRSLDNSAAISGLEPVTVKSEPSELLPCMSFSEDQPLEECEAAALSFLNDNPNIEDGDQACLKQLELELFNDVKPDFMSEPVTSPGPSTPQLRQAQRTKISVDGSLNSSQECDCVKSSTAGLEDDISTEDNGSSHQYTKSESDEMEEFLRPNYDGEEFQSLHDLDSLEAALCGEDDDLQYGSLDFQDTLNLANDLVDELSCIDVHSSILDNLPASKDMEISLECMDNVDQNDEEALLLAEVAKAEAVMTSSSRDCKSTPQSPQKDMAMYCSSGGEESYQKQCSTSSKCVDSDHSGGKGISSKNSQSKKKMKVDWTPDLHRKFVQAVEQLGVDKAIPSRILEIMGVQHLTRHNIASHLQKYRSHKKHMHSREAAAASWNQRRQPAQPPVVSRPPPIVPVGLHVWGHPTPQQFWPKPWQASDGTVWHQPPPVCLDAWGHPVPGAPFYQPQPVMRVPLAPMPGVANRIIPPQIHAENMPGFLPPKETVDAAISEVLKNPFTPLPLGLKPPSVESVLSELQKQGIKTVPFSS